MKGERQRLNEYMYNECPERVYNCPFCAEEGIYLKVTTEHFTVCEDMPLACPDVCGKHKLHGEE